MKIKQKKAIFICDISEKALKLIKCSSGANFKKEFSGAHIEILPPEINEKSLSEKITQALKKMGYAQHPIIISFSRNNASCRYLKIPSFVSQEIERIANLQASRYLPYPNNELITGYQIIQTDKAGYSHINLTIAHKNQIERYLKIFRELKPIKFKIILNSYGISNLYRYLHPQDSTAVMVLDVDAEQAEVVICSGQKLAFSRSFKLNRKNSGWEDLLLEEINKSRDAYSKEVAKEEISKIIIVGLGALYEEIAKILQAQAGLAVEVASCSGKINFSQEALEIISGSQSSFAGIIGLGLTELEDSLVLLPKEIKEETKKNSLNKQQLRRITLVAGVFFILALSIAKNLDNKSRYLKELKFEMSKIAKNAQPLEETERKILAVEKRLRKKPSNPDIFYELSRVMPAQVALVNFSYNDDGQITLRGQTTNLNSVFEFVSQLEGSPVFKAFNIKVRYATKKNTQQGELIDFEIACAKKK